MNFIYALFAFSGVYVTKVLHNCHIQAPSVVVIYNLCIFVIFNEYQTLIRSISASLCSNMTDFDKSKF